MSKILLNDVGFRNWGWVVLELPSERIADHGTIKTKKSGKKANVRVSDDNCQSVQTTIAALMEIVNQYDIDGLVFEMPSGGALNAAAASGMAMASAVAACLETFSQLPAEYIPPSAVKDIVGHAGGKAVPKPLVQEKVKEFFAGRNWDDWDEHQFDALACYLCVKNGLMVKTLSR